MAYTLHFYAAILVTLRVSLCLVFIRCWLCFLVCNFDHNDLDFNKTFIILDVCFEVKLQILVEGLQFSFFEFIVILFSKCNKLMDCVM